MSLSISIAHSAQVRADHMAAMYRRGLTLQQIGDHHEVTRERVRQILRQWHPEITKRDGGFHVRTRRGCIEQRGSAR